MWSQRGRWILRSPSLFSGEVARPPGYPGKEGLAGEGERHPIRSCPRWSKRKMGKIVTIPFLPSQVTLEEESKSLLARSSLEGRFYRSRRGSGRGGHVQRRGDVSRRHRWKKAWNDGSWLPSCGFGLSWVRILLQSWIPAGSTHREVWALGLSAFKIICHDLWFTWEL